MKKTTVLLSITLLLTNMYAACTPPFIAQKSSSQRTNNPILRSIAMTTALVALKFKNHTVNYVNGLCKMHPASKSGE